MSTNFVNYGAPPCILHYSYHRLDQGASTLKASDFHAALWPGETPHWDCLKWLGKGTGINRSILAIKNIQKGVFNGDL